MTFFDGSSPRIKSLDLQGYKTFAIKTEIELAPTITVVVGPNGSGKSNIADAIRWVLGEQSYSLLRGRRTEDMIFSGSETRPRASMAAATITFDNSDGWLPIDFSEVHITRRAYRDGQNEYLINGQRVRLRDVTELLANCGLGQRTYTIIGQGLVDAALSLKADERRKLFEEAAGIGLYRSRREEALRRLDNTRRNLERVQDILAELQPRLRSLKRQAKRAGEYEQVKTDLDDALRTWYGYHWYHLMDVVAAARQEAEEKKSVRDDMREQQGAVGVELGAARSRIQALRSELQAWSRELASLHQQREEFGRRHAVAGERLRGLDEQESLIRVELSSLRQKISSFEEKRTHEQEEVERRRQSYLDAKSTHNALEHSEGVEGGHLQAQIKHSDELRLALEELSARKAAWQIRLAQFDDRLEAMEHESQEAQAKLDRHQVGLAEAEAEVALRAERQKAAELAQQEAVKAFGRAQDQLSNLEAEKVRIGDRMRALQTEEARLGALQKVRGGQLKESEGFTRRLQHAVAAGELHGYVGRIGDQWQIEAQYRKAIAAALGDFHGSFAFDSLDDLFSTLLWMEQQGQDGLAALLPLSTSRKPPVLEPPSTSGVIGNAASLVQVEQPLQGAIDALLGQTVVVTDLHAARRILPDLPLQARVVTLQGDLFFPGGQVLKGQGATLEVLREDLERIDVEKRALEATISDVSGDIDRLAEALEDARHHVEEAQKRVHQTLAEAHQAVLQLEQAQMILVDAQEKNAHSQENLRALQQAREKLQHERQDLLGQAQPFDEERANLEAQLKQAVEAVESADPHLGLAKAAARLEVAQRDLDEVQSRLNETTERLGDLQGQFRDWDARRSALEQERARVQQEAAEAEMGMEEVDRSLSTMQESIQPAEHALAETEQKRNQLETQENQLRAALQVSERAHSHAQIELARRQEELISLRRRIEDDFGLVAFEYSDEIPAQDPLPFEGLVERLARVYELPIEMGSQVNSLRAQIRRMGAVNPEAQAEYEEVVERIEFLNSQMADLHDAQGQIGEVIAELDLLMEREFRKTFDAVASAFREAFKRLFGGGSARLILTDPGDLMETGIDIEARLPGRREQGLAVLSGGERSLVATALIFALLKISPTPFCVLDEVDAMLDEANVLRFTEMLEELSQETQFMIITHNRLTVQAAEVIYGVSMGLDSVSRVISLKLDEAEKELAA